MKNKKVLIVDDNKNNRLTLQFILEDWQEENPSTKIDIEFATDGVEAVDLCEKNSYDIILMDIMMPNMDGIEATKLIRAKGNNSLIIACSALSDNEHKNKILQAGAEDYLTKPINSELFLKRFSTYLNLVSKREEKSYNLDVENVINSNVYHRKTVFSISDEVALSEFWEYFLLQNSFSDHEEFSDMIRFIYGLGNYQIKQNYKFHIFFEENADNYYLTMDNILLLLPSVKTNLELNNHYANIYKIEGNKLTFSFAKESSKLPESKEEAGEKTEELTVFDFMEDNDLKDYQDLTLELKTSMQKVGTSMIESDVLTINQQLSDISEILSNYVECFVVSDALSTLTVDIAENTQTFITFSSEIYEICSELSEDLITWSEKLFSKGAPSIDFLDSSIIANSKMISGFVRDLEEVDVDEEMFEF